MFVIGTAGHVDHGKSVLVEALTGIDPDRLEEEKRRGMTIDLGFAWMTLPSGREVSLVDVPGHERFIKNMLAGVGGIDMALLVIAADESVMPQTREHLAILDLLQVSRGLIAITKKDLVDNDWLELVEAEAEELLKGTALEGAGLFPVSAFTGDGMPELIAAIDSLLEQTPPRRDIGRPRLPIDRSFVISGFGTVVTGTLMEGTLSVGQEVELVLAGKGSRIRGLQTHRKGEESVQPGTRTAANLAGISQEEAQRGDVLTIPRWLKTAKTIDVQLRSVASLLRPLKHNTTVTLHTGTSETFCRVLLLDRDQLHPGDTGWAQLRLEQPVPVVKGDYFIIRSSETTLGGGNVVGAQARRHRRKDISTIERLEMLQEGSSGEALLAALEVHGPLDIKTLAQQVNLSLEETRNWAVSLTEEGNILSLDPKHGGTSILVSLSLWSRTKGKVEAFLAEYHAQHPLRRGAPREEVRSRLSSASQTSLLLLEKLIEEGTVVEDESLFKLPQHQPSISDTQRRELDEYVALLESDPFSPPNANLPRPDLLNILAEEGKVVKVSDTVVFTSNAYQDMVDRVLKHLESEGKITVAQVRDLFNTSRKYALALMEHLDQRRITRRTGDERVLR